MISPGLYRHYKGKYYQVIGVAKHSETEEELVVYRALYGTFDLWVRPLKMFMEQIERNGSLVSRFELVNESPILEEHQPLRADSTPEQPYID